MEFIVIMLYIEVFLGEGLLLIICLFVILYIYD